MLRLKRENKQASYLGLVAIMVYNQAPRTSPLIYPTASMAVWGRRKKFGEECTHTRKMTWEAAIAMTPQQRIDFMNKYYRGPALIN